MFLNFIYAGSELIAMRKVPSGALHYYLNDHLGSARVVIDSVGVVKDKMEYFAFGEMETETSSTGQDLRYTGKQFDDEGGLNLYYYGARYYDPEIGRFAAIDPRQSELPEWGPYVYTNDNPLKYVDPDGTMAGEVNEERKDLEVNGVTKSTQQEPPSKKQMVSQTVNSTVIAGGTTANAIADVAVVTNEEVNTTAVAVSITVSAIAIVIPEGSSTTAGVLNLLNTARVVVTATVLTTSAVKVAVDPSKKNIGQLATRVISSRIPVNTKLASFTKLATTVLINKAFRGLLPSPTRSTGTLPLSPFERSTPGRQL